MRLLGILLSVFLSTQVFASSSSHAPLTKNHQSLTKDEIINVRHGEVGKEDRVDNKVVMEVLSHTPMVLPAQLNFVKNIAHSILNNPDRSVMSTLVETVLKDHSTATEGGQKSYFYTNDKAKLREIITQIVTSPDSYTYQSDRCSIKLVKKFTSQESQTLIGHNFIGHDAYKGNDTLRAVVCLGAKSQISKKENQIHWNGGAAITAFPER